MKCFVKGRSFKGINPAVLEKIEPFLVTKYGEIINEVNSSVKDRESLAHEHSRIIWWCWLQGLDAAPALVKACYNSLSQLRAKGNRLMAIDNNNWRESVRLPEYIVEKRKKGRISAALFSDLIKTRIADKV